MDVEVVLGLAPLRNGDGFRSEQAGWKEIEIDALPVPQPKRDSRAPVEREMPLTVPTIVAAF
jgi:hypothetical protein